MLRLVRSRLLFVAVVLIACIPIRAQAQAPDWSVTPNAYSSTMVITGELAMGTSAEVEEGDRIAAFIDGEVRGVASPSASGDRMLFFLTIYGNAGGGDATVSFKAYDASVDAVLGVEQTVAFEPNATYGSVGAPFAWRTVELGQACPTGTPVWTVDPAAYQTNMSITATVRYGGVRAPGAGDRLAAFAGAEVRGVVETIQTGDDWLFYLTVYGETSGEAIRFEAYDAALDRVWDVTDSLAFTPDAQHGLPSTPVRWTGACAAMGTETARERPGRVQPSGVRLDPVYPSATADVARTMLYVEYPQVVEAVLYDRLGRQVQSVLHRMVHGTEAVEINVAGLAAGAYYLRVRTATGQASQPVVVVR